MASFYQYFGENTMPPFSELLVAVMFLCNDGDNTMLWDLLQCLTIIVKLLTAIKFNPATVQELLQSEEVT
jgi:hypothetical protein